MQPATARSRSMNSAAVRLERSTPERDHEREFDDVPVSSRISNLVIFSGIPALDELFAAPPHDRPCRLVKQHPGLFGRDDYVLGIDHRLLFSAIRFDMMHLADHGRFRSSAR